MELNINNHIVELIHKHHTRTRIAIGIYSTIAPGERVWRITKLAKLSFKPPIVRAHSWRFSLDENTRACIYCGSLSYYMSEKLESSWGLTWLKNIIYISGQSERWMRYERRASSRREASLRPAHARRPRDYLGTDSSRPKLTRHKSIYVRVQVSPLRVSREARRDLWRSIDSLTMVVFKLRTSLWTPPRRPQIK